MINPSVSGNRNICRTTACRLRNKLMLAAMIRVISSVRNEDAVTSHYLRDALDAVLAGGTPEVQETMPVGCTLKWRR